MVPVAQHLPEFRKVVPVDIVFLKNAQGHFLLATYVAVVLFVCFVNIV